MIPQPIDQVPLFLGLSQEERELVTARLRRQQAATGELVYSAGYPSDALYVISSGWVKLEESTAHGTLALANLGAGSLLGEVDTLLGRPYSSSARAAANTQLLVLTRSDLENLIGQYPAIGLRFSAALGLRISFLEPYLVQQRLRNVELLSALSEDDLTAIARQLDLKSFTRGEIIAEAGTPGDAVYLIEEGQARLVSGSKEGDSFDDLNEGAIFGHTALITGRSFSATLRAVTDVYAWHLTRAVYLEIVREHPTVKLAFSRALAETLGPGDQNDAVERIRQLPLFSDVPTEAMSALVARLVLRHFPAGDVIYTEGTPGDALYVVEMGEVKLMDSAFSDAQLLERARSGESFGEMALLTGRTRAECARACTDSTIWVLYKSDFDDLMVQYPEISVSLSRASPIAFPCARTIFCCDTCAALRFFSSFATSELRAISKRVKGLRFRSGEVICYAGEPAHTLFMIEMGEIKRSSVGPNGEMVLVDLLGPGDSFGEQAMVQNSTYTTTAQAIGEAELWTISKLDFDQLMEQYPSFAVNVTRLMADRLSRSESIPGLRSAPPPPRLDPRSSQSSSGVYPRQGPHTAQSSSGVYPRQGPHTAQSSSGVYPRQDPRASQSSSGVFPRPQQSAPPSHSRIQQPLSGARPIPKPQPPPPAQGQSGYLGGADPNSSSRVQPRPNLDPNSPSRVQPRPNLDPNSSSRVQPRPNLDPNSSSRVQPRPNLDPNSSSRVQPRPNLDPNSSSRVQPRPNLDPNSSSRVQPRPNLDPNSSSRVQPRPNLDPNSSSRVQPRPNLDPNSSSRVQPRAAFGPTGEMPSGVRSRSQVIPRGPVSQSFPTAGQSGQLGAMAPVTGPMPSDDPYAGATSAVRPRVRRRQQNAFVRELVEWVGGLSWGARIRAVVLAGFLIWFVLVVLPAIAISTVSSNFAPLIVRNPRPEGGAPPPAEAPAEVTRTISGGVKPKIAYAVASPTVMPTKPPAPPAPPPKVATPRPRATVAPRPTQKPTAVTVAMAAPPAATAVPALPPIYWDQRIGNGTQVLPHLESVKLEPAVVAHGQKFWRAISVKFEDVSESGNDHTIYVKVLGEDGRRVDGKKAHLTSMGGLSEYPDEKPSHDMCDCNFNYPLYGDGYGFNIEDQYPSDKVVGMVMPMKRHVNYRIIFRLTTNP